jgi:hypothetical protein
MRKDAMKKSLLIVPALLTIGLLAGTAIPAQARPLVFMNSQGYQNQLAASRKAYADAVAAQTAPKSIASPRKRGKANKSSQ